ncbi:MAG: ORF6N domain-containing protein [Steroidobacteraceae bacterium]
MHLERAGAEHRVASGAVWARRSWPRISLQIKQQVRRNRKRFPADFMFQLTAEETNSLRSQIATLKTGRGQHRKYLPYVFTEHGAIMAATILNSSRAIEMSV